MVQVPRTMGRLRLTQKQAPVGHAVGVVLERAPGPPKPATGRGGPCADGVVFPEPHGTLPCLALVVVFFVDPVRGFSSNNALVEPAEPPRGLCLRVEPFRLQDRGVHAGATGSG